MSCTFGGRIDFINVTMSEIEDDLDFTRDWSFSFWINAAEANALSEVKVQLHVYLFPLLRPFRGPQSLSAGGRTGFKCVLSGGGSCGRAREQSGPPSASSQNL